MNNNPRIYALHGFLGRPSDWQFLNTDVTSINLFDKERPLKPFWEWAHRLNDDHPRTPEVPQILVGYSLGGRLALHAALDEPFNWDGLFIISAHPGLENSTERQERRQSDQEWAERFFSQTPWESLISLWNSQELFLNSPTILRTEQDYCRQMLANSLKTWSLGKQDDLRKPIQRLSIPVRWLIGSEDHRYVEALKTIKFSHPLSKSIIVPESSHRLLWEKPDIVKQELDEFVHKITQEKHAHI